MVGVISQQQDEEMVKEYLNELKFLIDTWGALTLKSFVQKMAKPDAKHFVGTGKLQEIKNYVKEFAIDMVVFDDDLSPSQLRNIEKMKMKMKNT